MYPVQNSVFSHSKYHPPGTQVYHIENKQLGTGSIFQIHFWLTSPGYKYKLTLDRSYD